MNFWAFSLTRSWLVRQLLESHSFKVLPIAEPHFPSSGTLLISKSFLLLVLSVIVDSTLFFSIPFWMSENLCSYGPMGNEAISKTIYSTLLGKDWLAIVGNLQTALSDIIKDHRDTTITLANFWDSADSSSVSLTSFIKFVVTLHIVNTLIQEDLQTTDDEANFHRLWSREIGDVFQYTDGNDNENEVSVNMIIWVYLTVSESIAGYMKRAIAWPTPKSCGMWFVFANRTILIAWALATPWFTNPSRIIKQSWED